MSVVNIKAPKKDGDVRISILNMLLLDENESILFASRMKACPFRKTSPSANMIKNQTHQAMRYFVVTTERVFFLHYHSFLLRFHRIGWREKNIIPLSSIVSVEGKMKRINIGKLPYLIIITAANDHYEMMFSKFGQYRETIGRIADIIQKANAKVHVNMHFPEPDESWKIKLEW